MDSPARRGRMILKNKTVNVYEDPFTRRKFEAKVKVVEVMGAAGIFDREEFFNCVVRFPDGDKVVRTVGEKDVVK
jgi:hypothetical protein